VLHIGQLKEGEELPYADDSEFVYDLPITFDVSDSVTLFVNYSLDGMLEKEEQGTLIWSILRAGKGTQEGSTNLIGEEDDWIGFETVSDSPYFIMTENEDEAGNYYKTVKLEIIDAETIDIEIIDNETIDAEDAIDADDEDIPAYNYYIRAAYYLESEEETGKEFYAAATVPFLPVENTDINEAQDDTSDEQALDEGLTQEDVSAVGDTVKDEMNDDEPALEESDMDNSSEDTEAVAADEAGEGSGDVGDSEGEGTGQDADNKAPILILDKKKVIMHVDGDDRYEHVTATIEPEGTSAEISWKSSNDAVATVEPTGPTTAEGTRTAWIRARGIGSAQITAECNGVTAVIKVDVVEEFYDRSDNMRIDGFKRESDDFVYTGEKITQNIRVYHQNTLLTEKTDYTISYKNNINAARYDSAKAPSLTINLKGQYSGKVTLFYTIKPLNINDVNIYNTNEGNTDNDNADGDSTGNDNSSGYEQAVTYAKTLKIPTPELTFGKKKLAINKDFVCDYTKLPKDYKKGDSYEAGKVYNYTVNGTGNFTGSFQMNLVVLKDKNLNFSSAAVTLGKKQYEYNGTALTKTDVTVEKLAFGKTVLDKTLYDYEVCADAVDGSYVMVYPTEAGKNKGYRGSKRVNLKLVGDRNIKDAVSGDAWKDSITFSQKTLDEEGGIYQEEENILAFGSGASKETLVKGKDYAIKYSNAKKAGKVTVTFTGKGRYKGTLKKTYQIKPNSDNNALEIIWGNNVKVTTDPLDTTKQSLETAYQKGGAVPEFDLKDSDNKVLKNKTDYTVKLTNNKTPGTDMSLEINGKGNYKGYKNTIKIKVTNGDINNCIMLVPDMPASTKPDAWKSKKITIKDVNGKKLTAGTDYSKEIDYKVAGGSSTPGVGSIVSVKVQGAGAYKGTSITGSYKIYDKSKSISKLKIVIDPQEYTGEKIELDTWSDIHVYATSADMKKKVNELRGIVEIVDYTNNIKSGTAKVTLRGSEYSEYGGMRTCSFKIKKRGYNINRVKGITLSPAKLSLALQDNEEKRTLTAKITAEIQDDYYDNKLWNSTVIWTTSNSSIATVEPRISNDEKTVFGVIVPKKEGTVTITAIAQDGNKKASCKVTIVDAPVLKQSGKTIEGKVGDTLKLEFEGTVNLSNVEFESSNSEMVSVDKNGLITMKKVGAARIRTYTNKRKYVQECYVVVKGEEDKAPEGRGLIYEQEAGTTDDTQAINALLQKWEDNPTKYDYVYIPAGVYRIDAVDGGIGIGGIIVRDNQKLIMSPSALIMAIANNKSNYQVIYVFGRKNVEISGGQIIGEREEHLGTGGEWGHGISVQGSTDVHISNMDISKCWGDGICLGEYDKKIDGKLVHIPCDGITIENCIIHHNRRNNLSITDAKNVTIDNCEFNNAKGTDPQYGICIEYNFTPTENVKIYNSKFKGNAKASMGIIKKVDYVLLDNCELDGNFYNKAGKNVVLKNTTIKGEIVDDPKSIRRE
ncbi:MAG: right-handed parallel beta-helix repeat-containing protein, partial [Lachnospiraceae bacterium]|nr:right-handed parallel beta-helix repeat-containing protein [Lachnospiraceae bacterium]